MAGAVFAATVSGQQPNRRPTPWVAPLLPAEEAWTLTLPAQPAAAAAMDQDRVYVPLLAPVVSLDAPAPQAPVPPAAGPSVLPPPKTPVVVALNRETGVTEWMAPLESRWPPVTGPGVVYVAAGNDVSALDAATGRSRWTFTLPGAPRAPLRSRNGLLLALIAPDELVGIRTDTPAIAWRRSIGEQGDVRMTADDGAVYLATATGRLIRIRLADGAIEWQVSLEGELSEPAGTPERVFVGSKANLFWALKSDSGKVDWAWLNRIGGDVIGAAVDGNVVYMAALDNSLRAFNVGNGNQRWKRAIPRPVAPPVAFGGVVAIAGLSPSLSTFVASSGIPVAASPATPAAKGAQWSAPPNSELQGPPLIDPILRPFRVAMVVLVRDGRTIGLRPIAMKFSGPAPEALTVLPGRELSVERLPGQPAPVPAAR